MASQNPNESYSNEMRSVIDRARSGAPAAGEAIRDLFSTDEIFHRITATADEEFARSTRLLFLSGLAAGLSIGLSFLGTAVLAGKLTGEGQWLIAKLLYPLGFMFIVIGRYQLFTENTLTPVTLVLTRIASLPQLLAVWGCVFMANIVGVGITSYVLSSTGVFEPASHEAALYMGKHALSPTYGSLFWKGMFAGWIVAGMVWLNHAARNSIARILIIFVLIYTVAVTDLAHCIIGSAKVLYLVFEGGVDWGVYLQQYLLPVTLGNTAGGVLLVALLNYSQTRKERFPDRDCGKLELTWLEWFFGHRVKRLSWRRLFQKRNTKNGSPSPRAVPYLGVDKADVVLSQFGDYECPTSIKIYRLVRQIQEESDYAIRYEYRHLPLSRRHPHATEAAVAAEAAANQQCFWEMHNQLFNHQNALEEDDLHYYARQIGLDMKKFQQDMKDHSIRHRIYLDRQYALSKGVRTTRNLLINGQLYHGKFIKSALIQTIQRQ